MSEQSQTERRFDDPTPESVVTRFGWRILRLEEVGEVEADSTYADLIIHAKELYDVSDHSGAPSFDSLVERCFPGPYKESGLIFSDWYDQLRLIPMRLLYANAPEIDSLTPAYVNQLMEATFTTNPRHGSDCMDVPELSGNKYICKNATQCPAKVTLEVMSDTTKRLMWSWYAHSPRRHDQEKRATKQLVDTICRRLASYGLADDAEFRQWVAGENKKHEDFLMGAWTPDFLR